MKTKPRVAIVNGQEHKLPPEVKCLIPGPGMRVHVPDHCEINGTNTLEFCRDVNPLKIAFILKLGGIFEEMFRTIMPEPIPMPRSYDQLQEAGDDVRHITGMIVMVFEAKCERGEKIWLNCPEAHLHPQQSVAIMCLVKKFDQLPTKTNK